ncbi:MAG: pyruvate kinase [Deltaproteobacteria bacterium]|nr:pyruvate kinase [Deltaproteobacteria bacterium]
MPATRILATLGPASWDRASIDSLARAGVTAFRLNFSHGIHEVLARVIADVRAVEAELGWPLALLGDLAGPKMRTCDVAGGGSIMLGVGDEVVITAEDAETTPGRIAVACPGLPAALDPGDKVLFDDGKLEVEVLESSRGEARGLVIFGGPLSSKKGVNLPGGRVDIPSITEKDEADLAFAIEHGVDWIALSFVQETRDVVDLKRRIAVAGARIPVIAKIERPLAVEDLDAILEVTDGIMVARGDLGVELGPETLPVVQKEMILSARRRSRLVITATQMLESMTHEPRPTRAEASDVANALFDGTDVVMLSGETAVGDHPVRVVETMRAICEDAEKSDLYHGKMASLLRPDEGGVAHAAIRAACAAAEEVEARAIAVFTATGWTALAASAWRPRVPIYAITPEDRAWRRLALAWGVEPVRITGKAASPDALHRQGIEVLLETYRLMAGDIVVLLSGSVLDGHGANTVRILRVGNQ